MQPSLSGKGKDEHAALREQRVVTDLARELFAGLDRQIIKVGVFGVDEVRADNRRVTPGIAATKPAFLENGDTFQAVALRKVTRDGKTSLTSAAVAEVDVKANDDSPSQAETSVSSANAAA